MLIHIKLPIIAYILMLEGIFPAIAVIITPALNKANNPKMIIFNFLMFFSPFLFIYSPPILKRII